MTIRYKLLYKLKRFLKIIELFNKNLMITRIRINGFKSLLDCDLYLGPFTCIAGMNAVGKSNLFDAISFLSNLSDKSLIEAAKSVRSENQKHSNIRDIFFKCDEEYLKNISFEIDMLIPTEGIDDLGQSAKATITSLKYILELKLNDSSDNYEIIEITKEELLPINQTETKKNIFFSHRKEWLDSVLTGKRNNIPFISTDDDKVKLHQDGNKGRTTEFIANKMPRTLLSTVTAESPTAFIARNEMRNWLLLQLEPSALRQPNSIFEIKNASITANGNNLPATLFRIHSNNIYDDIYQVVTNRVKNLVEDINDIFVEKDEKRDLLTLCVKFNNGLTLPAQSLSDGTLRFLGLSIINEDSSGNSLLCLEEPENGINPQKINEMVSLLMEMAIDTEIPVSEFNPLRQVIINTHSPNVVRTVPPDSLYFANTKQKYSDIFKKKVSSTTFSALDNTWKTNKLIRKYDKIHIGEIFHYLDSSVYHIKPSVNGSDFKSNTTQANKSSSMQTVEEHIQLQLKLL